MTNSELKLQIDTDITNKISQKSITPLNVGKNIKDTIDYIDQQDALKENTLNKSTNTALGTSNILFPTQNAVKTYVDNLTAETYTNKSTNIITDATSDSKYPSVKAIKDYVDANVGGTQDLQSVIENGGSALIGDTINYTGFAQILMSAETDGSDAQISLGSTVGVNATDFAIANGVVSLKQSNSGESTTLFFDTPVADSNLYLPAKPVGTYTIATLDDIKKIDLTGRVYANNAAAITGGLTANDVYRTATGELRIVV